MDYKRLTVLIATIAAPMLWGCALNPMTIKPSVDPTALMADKEPGAENVFLAIPLAEDTRADKSVGTRGVVRYGAKVTTEEDVSKLVTDALRKGFANKGYRLVENGEEATLKIRILEYRTDLQMGFWAGKAIARVLIACSLVDSASGHLVWNKEFLSVTEKGRVQFDTKKHREITLTRALTEVISKIMSEKELRTALRKHK